MFILLLLILPLPGSFLARRKWGLWVITTLPPRAVKGRGEGTKARLASLINYGWGTGWSGQASLVLLSLSFPFCPCSVPRAVLAVYDVFSTSPLCGRHTDAGRRKDCFGGRASALTLVIHRAGLNSPWRGLATDVRPPQGTVLLQELNCAERVAGRQAHTALSNWRRSPKADRWTAVAWAPQAVIPPNAWLM